MNSGTGYNERSWAIDLIGHIKHLVASQNRSVKDAGGEYSVRDEGGMLFPDVLLFGDRATARILQGWELKMPDTGIDDRDFFLNAERKARTLGLDSFLLWNVSHARLYIKDGNIYSSARQWNSLSFITTRSSVLANRPAWEGLAAEIVDYVNDLFDRNSLEGRQFVDAYKSDGIASLIMANTEAVAEDLRRAARRNVRLGAEVTLWWQRSSLEYEGSDIWSVLAHANLSNWIGKFLFAHVLQGQDARAQAVTQIGDDTSPSEALAIFERLSQACNFSTIFSDSVGLSCIPAASWGQFKQLNKLLTDLRIGSVEQEQLSDILQATVAVAVRKLRGQYATPPPLARLLVRLCVRNVEDDRILDPCCGSGTIARAALEQKLHAEVTPANAAASVFAGDIDAQAVQIATFAMAKPSLMHRTLRLFREDAFSLSPNTSITLRNPSSGEQFTESIGKFHAIASNLPFVAQTGRTQYGNALTAINNSFDPEIGRLSGRADVSAYLPFAFHPLLESAGRVGVIITNSWLGTTWGNEFFSLLKHYYRLKSVVTSGAGRWFQNSKVVTNILLLEKKEAPIEDDELIDFVVLTRPVEELFDEQSLSVTAAQIELGRTQDDTLTIRCVSWADMARFRTYGLGGNAQFVNCDWILDLPLVPVKSLFTLTRGERRGWNTMFYPAQEHGIENEYIKPVLKSPREIDGLTAAARREAFSCSRTVEELQELGHSGALAWIDRFKNGVNDSNRPLPEALAMAGRHWYEMRADALTDLVMLLDYGNRLFVARFDVPSFVDQRFICFKALPETDTDLCHALLNSAMSLFITEGMGFGRGLGVLDLRQEQVEDFMHILNPVHLSSENIQAIKQAFQPLLERNVFDVADELEQDDRKNFDDVIISVFDLSVSRADIYESLLRLVSIRQAALQTFPQ